MKDIPLATIITFIVSIALQIFGLTMLPMSKGFTIPGPAVACVVAFGAAMFLLARLTQSGVELGILVPLLAAIVPLVTMAIGVMAYGESASLVKIVLLVAACGLIGTASRFA